MGCTRVYHVGYGSVAVLLSRTFVPWLELDDHHTVGCSRTAETEAGYLVVDEYLRQVLDAVGHFVKGFCSLMKCTSRDGIHADEERTHILVRHERSLAGAHQVHQYADSCYQNQAGSPFVPDEESHAMLVFLRHALECGIERYPEPSRELFRFFARFYFLVRFEDEGAHRRRECQGVDSGKTHCHCHRQTELRIEYSGGTAHERYRDEHCHEDECGSHDGGRNAVYGVHRSLVRRLVSGIELRLNRLHDDDGVIDYGSDRQHESEQGQEVDTEACNDQEGECTYQRHEYTQGRDDGGPDVLQEDKHYEHYQQDGFQQGLDHLVDGSVEEVFRTHDIHEHDALRQIFPYLREIGVYLVDDFVCVTS